VIEVAFAIGDERRKHLLHLCGERQINVIGFGGLERVAQVLFVKADFEAWLKLRAMSIGPFALRTALPASPPLTALTTISGLRPQRVARVSASPMAAMLQATMI